MKKFKHEAELFKAALTAGVELFRPCLKIKSERRRFDIGWRLGMRINCRTGMRCSTRTARRHEAGSSERMRTCGGLT